MMAGLVVIIVHGQMMVANSLVLGLKMNTDNEMNLINGF